jgi:hypothetical protein
MLCNVEMEDFASAVFDDKEAIQESEHKGWHGEVHCGNDLSMVAQKGCPELPCLIGGRRAPDISRHGAFGNVNAEFETLTVNSRDAPSWILFYHSPDESSNLSIDSWPADAFWLRSKAPEQTKSHSMPADNRFRFNDNQGVALCWPDSTEKNPKHSISHSQSGARISPVEDAQLLAQCRDLKTKVVTRAKEHAEARVEAGKE